MRTVVLAVVAVWVAGCATTEQQRRDQRRSSIAGLTRIIPIAGESAPEAPDLRFQLAMLHFEEADELGKQGDPKAATHFAKAQGELEWVAQKHPGYARRREVLFWRAEAMAVEKDWAGAADAFALARQEGLLEEHVAPARLRLAEAYRHTNRCEQAIEVLEGDTSKPAHRRRCECLKILGRPADACSQASPASP